MGSEIPNPISPEDRARLQRTRAVGFRVRQQEYDELAAAAEEAGMPIGEWIREVSLRTARRGNGVSATSDALPTMVRITLEELAALRAMVLSLFGTTNPNLAKEELDQIVAYAESVKRERVEGLMKRHDGKAATAE